jgi:hypothetical protein
VIVQSFHNIASGKPVNLGEEIRGKMESLMPQDLVPFKCNGNGCGLSFPLHEKTNQVLPIFFCVGGSATPCASPPPRSSIFSDYSFFGPPPC